jgi:hypothetical protein
MIYIIIANIASVACIVGWGFYYWLNAMQAGLSGHAGPIEGTISGRVILVFVVLLFISLILSHVFKNRTAMLIVAITPILLSLIYIIFWTVHVVVYRADSAKAFEEYQASQQTQSTAQEAHTRV